MATAKQISHQFSERRDVYVTFTNCIKQLIERIIDDNGIPIHSITSRVKEVESLAGKLKRKPRQYKDLEDITDLSGLRVIVYLPDDVDRIATLIDGEFDIDRINSIDKRFSGDPSKFGYASLHQVCSINSSYLLFRRPYSPLLMLELNPFLVSRPLYAMFMQD